jgi:chorismate mutase
MIGDLPSASFLTADSFFDLLDEPWLMMATRGIRGATTVERDDAPLIVAATQELLEKIFQSNGIREFDEIVSAVFTTTSDLNSTFPAEAARNLGMNQVPLLCAREIPVPGSMPYCIRILLHLNTEKKQDEIVHVYLHEAKRLRPDVTSAQ